MSFDSDNNDLGKDNIASIYYFTPCGSASVNAVIYRNQIPRRQRREALIRIPLIHTTHQQAKLRVLLQQTRGRFLRRRRPPGLGRLSNSL